MAADDDTARFDGWDRVPMALASFAIGDRKCIELPQRCEQWNPMSVSGNDY